MHDVVAEFADRLPPDWRETIADLQRDLDRLAEERSPAFYGDEVRDIPASELFGEADARRAMTIADRLLDLYIGLLGEQR